jgi:hypothetical protein
MSLPNKGKEKAFPEINTLMRSNKWIMNGSVALGWLATNSFGPSGNFLSCQ